ncbi:MAG: sigma-E factor negative regulatory protein [Pseudomonadota bacterium]
MTDAIKMQLSAFVDGELSDEESELLIRRIGRDAELRATVAEYHAIGRIMRAETAPAGMDGLLAAIRDGIDADEVPLAEAVEQPPSRRLFKPLAGFAVAASVALVGVLSVSQLTSTVAPADVVADSYSTPSVETISDPELGARWGLSDGGLGALLTTVEIRQQQLDTTTDEEPESAEDDAEDAEE